MPTLETGVQFHLPTYAHVPLPQLVDLAKNAEARGVGQFWVTDNLRSRNSFVVLTAFASNLQTKLGTAITVQYFRNPVDLADMVASVSELMGGQELSIGLGFGNPRTHNFVKTPKPISMLRETSQSLRRLLDGETVCFSDYPTLLKYFNFNPNGKFELNFSPKTPIIQYCGSNGPLGLAVGGQNMEGLIFGGHYMAALRTGRVPEQVEIFDEAAQQSGRNANGPKIAEIKISISNNREAAREFVRESTGHRILNMYRRGYTHEDIQNLGVNLEDAERLDAAEKAGVSVAEFNELVTDEMVDAIFIAGEPEDCLERMIEVQNIARSQGFNQLMFSELGPNVNEALNLLCDVVIPAL